VEGGGGGGSSVVNQIVTEHVHIKGIVMETKENVSVFLNL